MAAFHVRVYVGVGLYGVAGGLPNRFVFWLGCCVTWQEPVVAMAVGFAVVSLYRHVRDLIGAAKPGEQASCHGCEECEDESTSESQGEDSSSRRSG